MFAVKKFSILLLIFSTEIIGQEFTASLMQLHNDFTQLSSLLEHGKPQEQKSQRPTISSLKARLYTNPEWLYTATYKVTTNYAAALKDGKPIVSVDEFNESLNNAALAIEVEHRKRIDNDRYDAWFGSLTPQKFLTNAKVNNDVYNLDRSFDNEFWPFAQKLMVPSGTEIALWGDLHGSGQTLVADLAKLRDMGYLNDDFKIIQDAFYMIFLGDYTDRGAYGVEVMYMLMCLKAANPHKVILMRGNHEDLAQINAYGFSEELEVKYGKPDFELIKNKLCNFYNLLPVVLYLGNNNSDFIQCCHGGMEFGYNPTLLLASEVSTFMMIYGLNQEYYITNLPKDSQKSILNSITEYNATRKPGSREAKLYTFDYPKIKTNNPASIGFMWSDFNINGETVYNVARNGGFTYGKNTTQEILSWPAKKGKKLHAVIRAHQHSESLPDFAAKKGAYPMWNGLVYTLLSWIGVGGKAFPYDTFCILKVMDNYNAWTLTHWWREIFKFPEEKEGRQVSDWYMQETLLSKGEFVPKPTPS